MPRVVGRLVTSLALVIAAGSFGACGDPSGTSTTSTTVLTTSDVDLSCAGPGVQRPNCGVAPRQAGDRGGALQYAVWALLVIGLAIVFTVVFRAASRTERAKKAEVGDRDWS